MSRPALSHPESMICVPRMSRENDLKLLFLYDRKLWNGLWMSCLQSAIKCREQKYKKLGYCRKNS